MKSSRTKLPELLAPAGSRKAFLGALKAGADAVYLGGEKFGARAYAENFTFEDIVRSIREAHIFGCKVYLTLNVLTKESEFEETLDFAKALTAEGLDGAIVQDLGLIRALRTECPGLDRRGVFYPRRNVLLLFGAMPDVQFSGRQKRQPGEVCRHLQTSLQDPGPGGTAREAHLC